MKIKIKETTYRGRPVISLYDLECNEEYKEYPIITLGVRKAKAILAAKDEISNFVKRRGG